MKFLIALFFVFRIFANSTFYPGLQECPFIEDSLKKTMMPYLIPLDHPLKSKLDFIFSQSRVTESIKSIEGAGFIILHSMPRSFVIVAKHPSFPGYIFKIHLDSEKEGRYGNDSIAWLTNRCMAARKIKQIIEKKELCYFVVPDKWLYLLPSFPPSKKSSPKSVILIATEMPIVSDEETRNAWKVVATKEHLKELYEILHAGYGSMTLPTNIPYLGNGIFAFVDTEKPVPKKRLKKARLYLSPSMQKYWDHLLD